MKGTKIVVVLVLLMSLILTSCSGAAPSGSQSNSSGADISIKGYAFNPGSFTVKVGTTVKWINNDNVVHTVTSDTGVFDSGNLAQGDTFTYTFTKAGEYPYHCVPHASKMSGKIIVTD